MLLICMQPGNLCRTYTPYLTKATTVRCFYGSSNNISGDTSGNTFCRYDTSQAANGSLRAEITGVDSLNQIRRINSTNDGMSIL